MINRNIIWIYALQAEGPRFEPVYSHISKVNHLSWLTFFISHTYIAPLVLGMARFAPGSAVRTRVLPQTKGHQMVTFVVFLYYHFRY